jgi:uncharacterized protein
VQRICFYHAGCPDGFGAAWAAWKAWGPEGQYRPRGHDDPLDANELRGALVVFVDIAPPNRALRALGEEALQVVVLDHHVTALERYASDPALQNALAAQGHRVHFDLGRSGAVLSWQYFHPDAAIPLMLRYVEDMDLWNWSLPQSEAVNAALSSHPRRFEVWDALAKEPIDDLAGEGEPILRAQRMEVERSLQNAHPISLGTRRVEAVNALNHRSLIGHELAKRSAYGLPCGVVYRLQGRRVDVSIYSTGAFDVSQIAGEYGGGGHRNAAGFHVALDTWIERFI